MRRRLVGSLVALLLLGALLAWQMGSPAAATHEPPSCPELTDSVDRLYSAYFLRPPEADGFEFWVSQYSGGVRSLPEISAFFAVSPEFASRYGSVDDVGFVTLVYRNVLGREPDAQGLAFWTSLMASGELDRGSVMLSFSESPEYIARTGTVPSLAGHFLWYPHGVAWACGHGSTTVAVDQAPGPNLVDVIGINFDPFAPQSFVVWTLGPARELNSVVINTTVPRDSFRYVFNEVTDNASPDHHDTAFVEVRSTDPVVRWAVVFYQSPIGGARPGWQ